MLKWKFRRTSLIVFASKTRNYLYRQINEGPLFKVQNSLQESRKTRVPSIVSKFQKRDGNFAEHAERAMRCESGSSQSSYIKFYASGVSVRPVARASDRHHRARRPRFCAASSPIVFYLAASMAALIVPDVRRSGKRLMCFAHFRDILSVTAELPNSRIPPARRSSRRSPQHFSIVASAFLAPRSISPLSFAPRQLFRPFFFTEFRGADIPSLLELYSRALTLYELSGNPLIPRRSLVAGPKFSIPAYRARRLIR